VASGAANTLTRVAETVGGVAATVVSAIENLTGAGRKRRR
jgi:hypothetical protein